MEQFFENIFEHLTFLGNDIALFIVAMLPVVELRGAIPLGAIFDMGVLKTFLISVIGNLLPVPFLILLARPIFNWLKGTRLLSKLTHKTEAHIMSKADKVMQYSAFGLFIFVAIPLPGTGAWTGAIIAAFLNMRFKYALPAISAGVIVAGILMTIASFGISSIVGFLQ